jgi:hypothetical protein
MKKIFLTILLIFCALKIRADIAPNPIQANGIAAVKPTEVKMVSEKVIVNLTMDSSHVYCYFKLHNEGKAEKMQIGFPYMNTTPYSSRFAQINVYQNGKKINDIDFFKANSGNIKISSRSWYLWDANFGEDETMIIEVSYSLPKGVVKNNLYYKFEYLLNTGSGWKDKIDTAEIIIYLKDINKELILKTMPENFIFSGNQMIWKFYNFEPAIKDDISIHYETEPGQYARMVKKYPPALIILNEKTILKNPSGLDSLDLNDIVDIRIIKDSVEAKLKYPNINSSGGLVLIYSDKFVPERLIGILNSKLKGRQKLKSIPLSEFKSKYALDVNGQMIKQENIPKEMLKIDESKIGHVLFKVLKQDKYQLSIKTN